MTVRAEGAAKRQLDESIAAVAVARAAFLQALEQGAQHELLRCASKYAETAKVSFDAAVARGSTGTQLLKALAELEAADEARNRLSRVKRRAPLRPSSSMELAFPIANSPFPREAFERRAGRMFDLNVSTLFVLEAFVSAVESGEVPPDDLLRWLAPRFKAFVVQGDAKRKPLNFFLGGRKGRGGLVETYHARWREVLLSWRFALLDAAEYPRELVPAIAIEGTRDGTLPPFRQGTRPIIKESTGEKYAADIRRSSEYTAYRAILARGAADSSSNAENGMRDDVERLKAIRDEETAARSGSASKRRKTNRP